MPVVYIHSQHGAENHLVAEALHKLMPNSELIDDGLNDGPAKAAAKTHREYLDLRSALRRKNLQRIYKEESASQKTWILVDEVVPATASKATYATDYEFAAVMGHSPLISIILKCDPGLGMSLGDMENPEASSAKAQGFVDFCDQCTSHKVFYFRNDYELELDVNLLSPTLAAEQVRAHIHTVKRRLATRERLSWIRTY
ncbi:hypothetical protein HDV63DRAFT_414947 [Trichoderma sp. SZMC 28014]